MADGIRSGGLPSWPELLATIDAYGGSAEEVLRRATIDGVSAEVIAEGTNRAGRIRAADPGLAVSHFTRWEAIPPEMLDLQVFDQTVWWVDVLRRPHLIRTMSPCYVRNVIAFLGEGADGFCEGCHRRFRACAIPSDAAAWLDGTLLMGELRTAGGERP